MELSIIGGGNVAQHLASKFLLAQVQVNNIYTREEKIFEISGQIIKSEPLKDLTKKTKADEIIIIAVSDSAIHELVMQIPPNAKVAYTSGAVKLSDLPKRQNIGVFYPLQTLSLQNLNSDIKIPFLLEATNEQYLSELRFLASKISQQIVVADSEYREKIHLSAVFANNFVNHLLFLSEKLSHSHKTDFQLLQPLMEETIKQFGSKSFYRNQTGPARRGDWKVIQSHIALLESPELEVYQAISKSITAYYKSKNNEL